ncbi:MAG: ribonuclease R [SAR324 cluster bacterium]|nr:ribonuclease R [SAR324 cluster bacterium]
MGIKTRSVLRMLERSTSPLTAKQIRKHLGIKKSQKAKLVAELYKLVHSGHLKVENGAFMLANPVSKKTTTARTHEKTASPKTTAQKPSSPDARVGNFVKNPRGYGFVNTGSGEKDIFVPEENQNGAMNGDMVEVRVFQKRGSDRTRGVIVKVLKRRLSLIVAKLIRGQKTTLAIPLNQAHGLKAVVVQPENDMPEIPSGELVELELIHVPDSEGRKSAPFEGKIKRILLEESLEEIGFQMILTENQVRFTMPEEIEAHAAKFPDRVVHNPESSRVDQRNLGYVTIDGRTARDFDDAVFVQKQEDGHYRLYVAIADVANYVRPNDPVDEEALLRGTSVYLPTHAIPMLPESLSNNLCSLKPRVNRLTLTCEMLITPEGEVASYEIYESIIKSQARLVYEDVDVLFEGGNSVIKKQEICDLLFLMRELSQIMDAKRTRRGAIGFSFPDYTVLFDANNHMTGIRKHYQTGAMKLIEQFMLEANETVARHCIHNKLPALYRVHKAPDEVKLSKLQAIFWNNNISVTLSDLDEPGKFNDLFDKIKDLPNKDQLQILLLRCMSLAVYSPKNEGHYGLAAEFYCHFTSPIRRYPDLVVHRALKREMKAKRQGKALKNEPVSADLAELLSQRERTAETVEHQSIDLMKVIFLSKRVGDTFVATVNSVDNGGITIELEPENFEWFIPSEAMTDDAYIFDRDRLCLRGSRTKRVVKSGDRIQALLVRADIIQRKLEFEIRF